MITGTVTANREAVIPLVLIDLVGAEHLRKGVLDTGFDGWLSLPSSIITELGLPWVRFGTAVLADGSETAFSIYECTLIWDDTRRTVLVYEMDADPLVGMALMYGFELVLPVLDGASFTLGRLDPA